MDRHDLKANLSGTEIPSMRILHTSDWHIGHRLYEQPRIKEHRQFLDWLLAIIKEKEVDVLLVAGDIFDTALPSSEATDLYYRFLFRLYRDTHTHAVITAGNHDSAMHLAAPQEFLRMGRIHVVGLASEPAACVITLPSENPSVAIAAVPYLSESELSHISFETEPERSDRYRERLKELYRQCVGYMPPGLPKILMGHLFVRGGQVGDSERNIQIGGATAMQISDFPDDVTYVALGHLHRPHAISGASCPVQYAGSPLPLRFNEASYRKKVYLLDIPTSGDVGVEEIEIPIFKELCTVSGNFDEVSQMAMSAEWNGKYIQVQLKLDRPEVGISDKIREMFHQRGGEVLSVEVELPAPTERQEIPIEDMQQPTEIFEQFYKEKFNENPDERMMETFDELLKLVEEHA